LSHVVLFILIVINDVLLSVLDVGREVLEVINVKRVSQNIIGVDTFQMILTHGGALELL